jgi:hypothetical protein
MLRNSHWPYCSLSRSPPCASSTPASQSTHSQLTLLPCTPSTGDEECEQRAELLSILVQRCSEDERASWCAGNGLCIKTRVCSPRHVVVLSTHCRLTPEQCNKTAREVKLPYLILKMAHEAPLQSDGDEVIAAEVHTTCLAQLIASSGRGKHEQSARHSNELLFLGGEFLVRMHSLFVRVCRMLQLSGTCCEGPGWRTRS